MAQLALFGHMKPLEQKSKGADFQDYQRSCGGKYLVGPVQSAELAYGGILCPENSAKTSGDQSEGNRASYAGFEALCRIHLLGPTATTSQALAGAKLFGGDQPDCQLLTGQQPNIKIACNRKGESCEHWPQRQSPGSPKRAIFAKVAFRSNDSDVAMPRR